MPYDEVSKFICVYVYITFHLLINLKETTNQCINISENYYNLSQIMF